MPGHIFDTNVLRNFVLCSAEHLLTQVCPGNRYWSGIVKDELLKGPAAFERVHEIELLQGDPDRTAQLAAFQRIEAALKRQGLINLRLSSSAEHAEALEFFACCVDEEDMDPGEAESFALAAYRGLTFYTDDLNAYRAVDRYNMGSLRCPRPGGQAPHQKPVEVHSTPWLLLELVRQGHLSMADAEALFLRIKEVWYRYPNLTLRQLRKQSSRYW